MKSLKKTLSLVLVLVMVLGMFGIASAFTDDSSIQYKEAVEVMTGIGAINGYTDGSFKPTGNINRAEAAKMVAYTILGADVADTLTGVTSSFTDMSAPAYKWAIPYVEYLTRQGIIDGVGNNRFNPGGNVTGYELGKMLLCALGYGAKDEYVGTGWDLQVAIDARTLGIYAGRVSTANALGSAASREEAALYCFNSLRVGTVTYIALLDTYSLTGSTIMSAVYPTLTRAETSSDAFGRPSVKWTYGAPAKQIALTTATPILTYNTAVTAGNLKTAISNAGYSFATTGLDVYRNSNVVSTNYTAAQISAVASSTSLGGNGTVIEVYGNSTTSTVTRIVVVATYAGYATITRQDNTATTNIDERQITVALNGSTPAASIVLAPTVPGFDAVFTATATAATAGKLLPVLVTPNGDNGVASTALTVAAAETATLTPTSYSTNSFVADGKTYYYSDTFQGTKVGAFSSVDVVLDAYGYVIACNATGATANYAVATRFGAETTIWGSTNVAELVLADGSVVVVPYTTTNTVVAGNIVSYAVSNGTYSLTNVGTAVASSPLVITNGKASFTWNNTATNYANANTLFVVRSGAGTTASPYTYAAYVGTGNVPSLSGTVAGQIFTSGTTATVVYIQNPTASSSTTETIFLPTTTPVKTDNYPTYSLYTYAAVVDGEITTLTFSASLASAGVYTSKVTDVNGVTTLGNLAVAPVAGTITYSGGNLVYASTQIAAAATCPVYVYSASAGTLVLSSLVNLNGLTVTQYCVVPNATSSQAVALFVYVA